jgi:hypothetical protein
MALTQEDCITAHRAEKKWKTPTGPSNIQSPRYRVVPNAQFRAPQRNAPPGRLVFHPPQQQGGYRPPVPPQQPQQFGPRPNNQQFQQKSSTAHGQIINSFSRRAALIAVSIAEVRTTSSKIVLGTGSLIKGRVLIRTIKAWARSE